jgi:hypothetical protein
LPEVEVEIESRHTLLIVWKVTVSFLFGDVNPIFFCNKRTEIFQKIYFLMDQGLGFLTSAPALHICASDFGMQATIALALAVINFGLNPLAPVLALVKSGRNASAGASVGLVCTLRQQRLKG